VEDTFHHINSRPCSRGHRDLRYTDNADIAATAEDNFNVK
jgi:hypothetical protein